MISNIKISIQLCYGNNSTGKLFVKLTPMSTSMDFLSDWNVYKMQNDYEYKRYRVNDRLFTFCENGGDF